VLRLYQDIYRRSDEMRQSATVGVGEFERWAGLAAATAAAVYGLSRRNAAGMFLAAGAVPLAYRSLSGHWPGFGNGSVEQGGYSPNDTRVALSGDRGVHVRESVRIERPIEEVYRFWRDLENLPTFMAYLESVTDLGQGRSHWCAKGPAGVAVEWDAEIINDVPNKVIGWRSLPDSDVVTAGSVNFSEVRGGRATQLDVHLQYAPPAGKAGALVASMMGREPSQTIREDLRRVKNLLEAGEIPRTDVY
jgi:uncharacterized membrane protein